MATASIMRSQKPQLGEEEKKKHRVCSLKYCQLPSKTTIYILNYHTKVICSTITLGIRMENEPTPEDLQRKLYFLLEQLQGMARELPQKYQMRVPIELLSGLANCLLNDTVFEIVKGLMEIQHVTEKHLFQQRLQVISNHTLEIQNMINTTPDEQQDLQKTILLARHREELKQTDMKLVLQLDQKVSDQQTTLEQAGVPGFYVTKKPIEVKVQMYLLDFILRLSRMEIS